MRSTPNVRVKSFNTCCFPSTTTREKLFLRESLGWRGREQQDFASSARVHACRASSLRFLGRVGAVWKRPLPGQNPLR